MAFTFTSISSSIIEVASGTGTLSELYTDAIAHTPGCMTNPSANVYQVEGNRELELENSTTLTIETGDTIQWNRTSHGNILEVQGNASIIFQAGSTMIMDTNGTHMGYAYFYGSIDVQGTSGSRVVWDLAGRCYFAPYGNGSQANGGQQTVSYLTIQDMVNSTSYGMFFQPHVYTLHDDVQHTYDNIIVSGGPTEVAGNGWNAYWAQGSYHNFTFTNIDLTNGNGFLCYNTANLLIDGGTALNGDTDSRCYGQDAGLISAHYNTINNNGSFGSHNLNQNKTLFKNYTFDDGDDGINTFATVDRGATVYCDSCTFQNATRAANIIRGNIVVYNPTFSSISGDNWNYNTAGGASVLHARKMTLSVEDSGGSPIADATVTFRQKQGRETWVCTTDSNGDVLDPHGEPIWLIEQEETTNGVYSQWSDGTGDQVHIIEVYKDGYEPHSEEVAMNQDRTKTIVLSTETQSGTTLNNVTINGTATIY